jgi:hypothetical protein
VAKNDAERTVPGFHPSRLPPPGFDVRTASERELLLHGIPRRPNPETHPRLAALWSEYATRRITYVTPELEPAPFSRQRDSDLLNRRRLLERELARLEAKELWRDRVRVMDVATSGSERGTLVERRSGTPIGLKQLNILKDPTIRLHIGDVLALLPETNPIWSGAYVQRPVSEPITTVTGQWNVPGVSPPASAWQGSGFADGTYLCFAWVGIDGTDGSNDVLQAGTGSQCIVQNGKLASTSFYAWTEWFSLPSQVVNGFQVQVGDQILCTVCAPYQNTNGVALFLNRTTNQAVSIPIFPPAATSLSGNVAEWIVEDPGTYPPGALFPFPSYGSVFFTQCTAGTKNTELNLWDGKEMDMVQGGVTLSWGVIQNKSTLWCHD